MQATKGAMCTRVCQRRANAQSLDEYRQMKLLPHINEEYQFRITNKLLIEKIANPRRDRIIIDSLAHTSHSHFYKNKKSHTPLVDVTTAYRRKIVLTAARKNRQKCSDSHLELKVKRRQREEREISVNKSEWEGNRENESEKNDGESYKNGQMAVSRTFFELRGNLAGKIVRNNSSYMMRLPKKAVIRNNYYFNNTCNEEFQKDFSRQHPQQLIKKIAKRIYQEEYPQKQNINM